MENGNQSPPSWAALSGNWSFQGTRADYQSPEDSQLPVGVALSSARIRNGRLSVGIRLNNLEHAGRILLGYNPATESYYSVGLGGYERAYLVDEYIHGRGWRAVNHRGGVSQLDEAHLYAVEVEIRGQRLVLRVDGIELIDQQLPHPLEGNQAGLFAWGPGPVNFEGFAWSDERPRAFVVMQFTEPYNSLYSEVISPVCQELEFEAYRADDVFRPGIILQDIISGLVESDVIIAEISPTNPNVFYELGYAHARNQPTVLLARSGEALPFDISGYRVIFYDDTIRGKNEVEDALRNHLSNIRGTAG